MFRIQYIIIIIIGILLSVSCKKDIYEKKGLIELTSFGDNKGNLNVYFHKPINAIANMPLVIVLHGCSQTAKQVAADTEWNTLADKYGFYVLYPEQKLINNSSLCFNWFLASDNEKDKGETASIKTMTDFMMTEYDISSDKIFVTGMSAGAAMTVALLATYPEVYSAGAPLAGMPYKALKEVFSNKTAEEWGEYVKLQNPSFNDSYPKLMILQGKKDLVVNFENANFIETQWLNLVYGNDLLNDSIVELDYNAEIHISKHFKNNKLIIEKVFFDKLGHTVPVDPGNGIEQGGKEALFAKDADYFSSYWIAQFFNLIP